MADKQRLAADANHIIDEVTGYADGFHRVVRDKDVDPDVLEDFLLDHNIERCTGCGWRVDSWEFLDEEENPTHLCEACREDAS